MSALTLTMPVDHGTPYRERPDLADQFAGEPLPRGNVALVGTHPPTACGLATYTSNLRLAIHDPSTRLDAWVVRLLEEWEPEVSPHVSARWIAGDSWSLACSLEALAAMDAVIVQHEFGIYPGPDGVGVLDLVDGVSVPIITVLHTAPIEPTLNQRFIVNRLLDRSSSVVVHSTAARQRIVGAYDADPEAVTVIPHGATGNFGPGRTTTPGVPTILTWGLLGPGKGIERGIDAVARLRQRGDEVNYVIAGQTHPKVLAGEGEKYRQFLVDYARSLGVADQVQFDPEYRTWASLRSLVRSADIVLIPYDTRDQVSSGVLVEALASGKPIIATAFPHAIELLSNGAGVLVPHGDSDAMANEINSILSSPLTRDRLESSARDMAASMLWPVVGAAFRGLVDQVVERSMAL